MIAGRWLGFGLADFSGSPSDEIGAISKVHQHLTKLWVMIAAVALPLGPVSATVLNAVLAEESRLSAKIGIVVMDLQSGRTIEHRATERFPLTSTFKAFACGAVLVRADAGRERLDRMVSFARSDLVTYSPVTERFAGQRDMSIAELCAAATAMSDNTAANLILGALGGPEGFTRSMREIGDPVTRLDRRETALNEGKPGDERDTTTPAAAVANLKHLLLGDTLSSESRVQLERWLAGNMVADGLLRAALPNGWRIADRTGAGGYGSRSIIALVRPLGRKPLLIAIYVTDTITPRAAVDEAIVRIGRVVFSAVEQ